ncbi:RecQ family ATP-dependent DNA helicase [Leeuwenhoekiella parthenopeia]|uniref:ATP-dependent DNA helicase RecQ n=1 Tax=Leeuwenhoekiella parthenopeia TaxID=2890320 RepID=A0ABS8GZU6_9FLAO|nr:ATP-dependent DNA helicase RecQ [Leeuwenhoekiella parthenopeia]MCC4214621.1 RecQ family ATP-dependent DNA helicase [Leeuwenhoekiella parthenopeia]
MNLRPLDLLKSYWGYDSFRPGQQELIDAVLEGRDTFALLPTGGGKSVCYQIPALLKPGISLVISPLLSLMRDQVMQLQKRNIKALYIPGGIPYHELDTLLDNCIYGNYKLLYLSPERLQNELVLERIKQMNVSLIAIDEAHCISQWGHDFRPAYRMISRFRESLPDVNCIALTATATGKVQEDIIEQLQLNEPAVFKNSFERKNLAYRVLWEEDKRNRLVQLFKHVSGSGIVYVRSRKTAMDYAAFLHQSGVSAHFYHGGLSSAERQTRFEAWSSNKVQVMVATSAFGMGIDKADVSTVVHVELPESMESYFQEAGRAGRNGEPARSLIFVNPSDESRLANQFLNVLPSVSFVKKVYKKLNSFFQVPYGGGEQETFRFDFSSFCKTYAFNTLITYNALQLLDRNSIIILSQEFYRKATLQLNISPVQLTYYLIQNPALESVVKSVLRTYAGIYDQPMPVDHVLISKKAGVALPQVHEAFLQLEKDELAVYDHTQFDTAITFLVQREDDFSINPIAPAIKAQNTRKLKQVQAILSYVKNKEVCRSKQLLAYFEEHQKEACGICDVCRSRKKQSAQTAAPRLKEHLLLLLSKQQYTSRELADVLKDHEEKDILKALKDLLNTHKIKLTPTNRYTIL